MKTFVQAIGLMSRVLANDPKDQGSILGRVIPKTPKMVLDATLLNTQHYKVRIKVMWSNPGIESRLPIRLGMVAFGSSSTKFANFTIVRKP